MDPILSRYIVYYPSHKNRDFEDNNKFNRELEINGNWTIINREWTHIEKKNYQIL